MITSSKLLWRVAANAVAALSAILAAKAVGKAWTVATGEEPPAPDDPNVSLRRAVTWAVASALGVAVSQFVVNRLWSLLAPADRS